MPRVRPAQDASAFAGNGEFWSAHQPGLRFAQGERGTRAFFRDVERQRYTLEPHIPEVVRFDRWANCAVLEGGCGIATDGIHFARAGARYTGLDASSYALELARRRFELEGVDGTFVAGSVSDLPFADESFDLVYSHGVIHHIHNTERAVAEFHRVLRPRGTVLAMLYHRASFNYAFTIMFVRRVLAASLLVPGGVGVVARLTGESAETLDGHRRLLREHGFRYLTDRQLFLSNNTDGPGNPLSKAYTTDEAKQLFRAFDDVKLEIRHLNLRLYPGGGRFARTRAATSLERRFGWHLYVIARKQAAS
jgi:ubiquinone/menaquinone biosynthesis C-methylase UbiE